MFYDIKTKLSSKIFSDIQSHVYFLIQLLIVGLGFFSLLITTNFLDVESRGQLVTISTCIGLLVLLFDAGNGFSLSKSYAKYKLQRREIITIAYALAFSKTILLFVLVIFAENFFSGFLQNLGFSLQYIWIAFLISTNILFFGLISPTILIEKNLISYGLSLLIFSGAGFLGLLFVAIFFQVSLSKLFYAQFVCEFFALFLAIFSVRSIFTRPTKIRKNLALKILKDGFLIYISSLANFANSKAVLLLIAYLFNSTTVAVFSVVFVLVDKIWLFGDAIGTKLFRTQASKKTFQTEHLIKGLKLNGAVVIFVNLILYFSLPTILNLLFPEEYSDVSSYILPMMLWSLFCSSWRIIWLGLNAYNSAISAKINIFGATFNVFAMYVALTIFELKIGLYALSLSSIICCTFGIKQIFFFKKELRI